MSQIGLHFMAGKKRSGKTMVAVKMLWRDIALTERVGVGNVPVVWPGAQDYLGKKYGFEQNLHERLYIITDASILRNFWAHRGFGWQLPVITPEQWGRGQRPDLSYAYRWKPTLEDTASRIEPCNLKPEMRDKELALGSLERIDFAKLPKVIYFLDEIQNIYPAKQPFPEEPILRWYLSQQSKLSDIILCTTQTPDWVDKSFRDLADDWMYLTNWGRRQKGFFRMPKRATWSKYPKQPGQHDNPDLTGQFKIDIEGLGQTYDTSAGVGIEGNLDADTEDETPGIHWGWIFPLAALLLLGVWFSPKILRGGFNAVMPKAVATPAQAPATNTVIAPVPIRTAPPVQRRIPDAVGKKLPPPGGHKQLVGLTIMGPTAAAYFSDGTRMTPANKDWVSIIYEEGKPTGLKTPYVVYRIGQPAEND